MVDKKTKQNKKKANILHLEECDTRKRLIGGKYYKQENFTWEIMEGENIIHKK